MDEKNVFFMKDREKQPGFLLRQMLWFRHGCSVGSLYGDDGEMQCNSCGIDFLRDTEEHIHNKFYDISMKKLKDLKIIK